MLGNHTNGNKVNSIIFFRVLIGFSNRMVRYVVPLFVIFLSWDSFSYGLLFSVSGYLATGVVLGLGYITDVRKRKYTMIAGIGLASLSMFLFYISSFTEIKGWMIAAYSLFGVSGSLAQISLTTLLADISPSKKDKTKFFSIMAFFWNLTGVFTPLLGGAFLTIFISKLPIYQSYLNSPLTIFVERSLLYYQLRNGYMLLILIVAIFLFVTMLLAFKFPIPDTTKEEAKEMTKDDDWKEYEETSKKPIRVQLAAFFVCEAIIGFTSGVAIPFIRFYIIEELGATDIQWAYILSASNVGIAAGSLLVLPMSNKMGNEKVLALLHFLVPALALGITLGPTLVVVALFFVIRGTSANMSRPTWNAFFYSWLPPKYRGTSTGFVSAGRRLSRALGTSSGVFIYNALLAWTFPIATLGYPIAIMIPIIAQRFLKGKKSEKKTALPEDDSLRI